MVPELVLSLPTGQDTLAPVAKAAHDDVAVERILSALPAAAKAAAAATALR